MPDIKHNFMRGKMNKDHDERLVANGEYRDAMNIQVSTSDNSDVGTVQNILGNRKIGTNFLPNTMPELNTSAIHECVGSIADEKNNKLYYFIGSETVNLVQAPPLNWKSTDSDGIVEEYSNGTNNYPVLLTTVPANCDSQYEKFFAQFDLEDGKTYELIATFSNNYTAGGYQYQENQYFVSGDDWGSNTGVHNYRPFGVRYIANGTIKETFVFDKSQNNGQNTARFVVQLNKANTLVKSVSIDHVSIKEKAGNYILEYDTENDIDPPLSKSPDVTPVFVDPNGSVLKFPELKPITGINIIDDMLFWTDNNSEPKKINIPRCIEGTNPNGLENTNLINPIQGLIADSTSANPYGTTPMLEEHITIIKKLPIHSPTIQKETFRDRFKKYTAYMSISNTSFNTNDFLNSSKGNIHDFQFLRVGDTFRTKLNALDGSTDYALEWSDGDEVVLHEYSAADTVPDTPLTEYRIKGTISNWEENSFSTINPIINNNGSFQLGSAGHPDHWILQPIAQQAIRWEWLWTGNSLKILDNLAVIGWVGISWKTFDRSAESPLNETITFGETYDVSFSLNQINNTPTSLYPIQGSLEVWLIHGTGGTSSATHIITIDDTTTDSDNNSPWGNFDENIIINNSNTVPNTISNPYASGNSIYFLAKHDPSSCPDPYTCTTFWMGELDDVKVEHVITTSEQAQCEIRINSINGTPPSVDENEIELKYAIDLYDQNEKLFEFNFPRFAYRYKYIDGEYSSFSPFSNVTFAPGKYGFNPQEGYNLGMTNTLKSITLKGFLSNAPLDIVSVDILYKEEDSPNIYIVDTIKDFSKTQYKITSSTLKNGLTQSNQLLRHWDNVPRKALGQEIIGGRVVYGNYLQNYDLTDSITNTNYSVELFPEILSKQLTSSANGISSIKSLREYQVGIVYADKYGRQTPILTNENATVKIGKNKAENKNELRISIGNVGHPINMEYFKFYIKDISSEYYNLAMDRYYDAEDGNIWLAFPSSDRNKVDIDDFLILKKGVASNSLIKEAARYKIIDIANEAPENIKRNEFMMASRRHSNTVDNNGVPVNAIFAASDLPFEGDDTFSVDYNTIASSSFSNLHNEFNSRPTDKYYITLSNEAISKVSSRYEVVSLNLDDSETIWNFTLKLPFTSEVNEFTDDVNGVNSSIILDDTYLNIYKSSIDNSARFDGRFFVKIFNDDIFRRNVVDPVNLERETQYKAISDGARKIYGLETDDDTSRIKKHYNTTTQYPEVFYDKWTDATASPNDLSKNVTDTFGQSIMSWRSYINATNNMGIWAGTLNNDGSWGTLSKPAFMWMHYDAYFRGFNVDPDGISRRKEKMEIHEKDHENQAFEDVWFFDKSRCAGQFENSNNSPSSGWDSKPNPGNGTALGIKNDHTGDRGAFIDLSFGGIQPNDWATITDAQKENESGILITGDGSYLHHRDSAFYDLENENLNYSQTQGKFMKNIAVGSQFRFKEDPLGEIYTIIDASIKFRIRYEDITTGLGESGEGDYYGVAGAAPNAVTATLRHNSCYPLQTLGKNGQEVKTPFLIQSTPTGGAFDRDIVNCTDIDSATGERGLYKTSTFLRASNYTKNYRITLDKKLTWNPWENTNGYLTGGQVIRVEMKNYTHGINYVDVVTLNQGDGTLTQGPTGKGDTGGSATLNIFEDKRQIELGMVIQEAPDGDSIPTDKLPMVSKIEIGGGQGGSHRIYFKNYNGGDSLTSSATGTLASSPGGTGEYMTFFQYPVNGLSPNSAKNLNHFKNSKGFDVINSAGEHAGTDALGYTIEFIEEITIRPEEDVLPENPAVWETEPKKIETDLDIYHATGGFNKINISNIAEFLPAGSIIEHENSNAIPPNTTITSVASNGTITLSEEIIIDPSLATDSSSWGN